MTSKLFLWTTYVLMLSLKKDLFFLKSSAKDIHSWFSPSTQLFVMMNNNLGVFISDLSLLQRIARPRIATICDL